MTKTQLVSHREGIPFEAFAAGTMDATSFVRWLVGHKSMEGDHNAYKHSTSVERMKERIVRTETYTSRFLAFMDHVEHHPEIGETLCATIVANLPEDYHGLRALFSSEPSRTPAKQWARLLNIQHLHGFLRNSIFCDYSNAYLMHHFTTPWEKTVGHNSFTNLLDYTYFSLGIKSHVHSLTLYASSKFIIDRYFSAFAYSLPYLERAVLADRQEDGTFARMAVMSNSYESVFCFIPRHAVETRDCIVDYRKKHPWRGVGADPLLQCWAYGYLKETFHDAVKCAHLQNFHLTSVVLDHVLLGDIENVCRKVMRDKSVKVPALMWGHVIRRMLEQDHPLNLEGDTPVSTLAHNVLKLDGLRLVLREMVFYPESKVWNFPWRSVFQHHHFERIARNHIGFLFEGNNLYSADASAGIRKLLDHPDWLVVWTWDLWLNRDHVSRSMIVRLLERTGEAHPMMQKPLAMLGNQPIDHVLRRMQVLHELNANLFVPQWKLFCQGWDALRDYLYTPAVSMETSLDVSGVL